MTSGYSQLSGDDIVLFKHREILIGTAIGVAVFIADTFMDAANEGTSFSGELRSHSSMILYRLLFVVAGFVIGWLLWQRNKAARDFDRLRETLDRLRHECEKRSLLVHASLQVLLTRTDFHLPAEAEQLVRGAYEAANELQTIVR
jgi:hypothetical protein